MFAQDRRKEIMTNHRWVLLAAAFFGLTSLSSSALAQVGTPAQMPESDRDASSTESGPSLGQSQQAQTKSQPAGGEGQGLNQGKDSSDNKQDRSGRMERPSRHDRPPRPERFRK
jgi:hypothetical protein